MAKIFICYRREDSAYPAQQIYGDLTEHFGSESVIFDIDTIPFGIDFREYLNMEVSKCDILLAVIGDQWIGILKQRLDEPNDFVRIEIQAALERDIPVVPILVGKASMPIEKNLPTELARLAYRNAAEVRAGPDLQTHLKRLISGLDRLIAEREQKDAEKEHRLKVEGNRQQKFEEEQQKSEAARRTEEGRIQREAEAKRRVDDDTILDKEKLRDKMCRLIAEKLSVDLEEVVPEADLVEDLYADELDLVELIMSIEEEFDVEISDEDAEKIRTVKNAIDYVHVRV